MKCKTCFETFIPKRTKQRYCSRRCNAISQSKKIASKFVCPRCPICGKDTARSSRAKYCSLKCQGLGKRGNNHHNWHGGIRKHPEGYIYIYSKDHPFADKSGYILEHRLTMEKKIGRYLTRTEVIHHINGIKNDNRIENLVLLRNQSAHLEEHNYLCDGIKRKRQSS
jgi:hypothetical protein